MTNLKSKYFTLYDQLPPDIAERAKENWDEEFAYGNLKSALISPTHRMTAIKFGIRPYNTKEGERFWELVYNGNYDAAREIIKKQQ